MQPSFFFPQIVSLRMTDDTALPKNNDDNVKMEQSRTGF